MPTGKRQSAETNGAADPCGAGDGQGFISVVVSKMQPAREWQAQQPAGVSEQFVGMGSRRSERRAPRY